MKRYIFKQIVSFDIDWTVAVKQLLKQLNYDPKLKGFNTATTGTAVNSIDVQEHQSILTTRA